MLVDGTIATRRWFKARRCTVQTCVEVKAVADRMLIRDSKQLVTGEEARIISVPVRRWAGFLSAVAASPSEGSATPLLRWRSGADGWVTLSDAAGTELGFDSDEWSVFVKGISEGDFHLDRLAA